VSIFKTLWEVLKVLFAAVKKVESETTSQGTGEQKKKLALEILRGFLVDILDLSSDNVDKWMSFASKIIDAVVAFFNIVGWFIGGDDA